MTFRRCRFQFAKLVSLLCFEAQLFCAKFIHVDFLHWDLKIDHDPGKVTMSTPTMEQLAGSHQFQWHFNFQSKQQQKPPRVQDSFIFLYFRQNYDIYNCPTRTRGVGLVTN